MLMILRSALSTEASTPDIAWPLGIKRRADDWSRLNSSVKLRVRVERPGATVRRLSGGGGAGEFGMGQRGHRQEC